MIDRALRELARRPGVRVVVAGDGSVPLAPRELDAAVEVRTVAGPEAVAALAGELGGATVVGADVVRLPSQGPGEGVRVEGGDGGATRRAAEDAVFGDLMRGDLGLAARWLNKPLSTRLTRALLLRLPVTPNQITLAAAALGLLGCWLIASGRHAAVVAGFLLEHVQSVLDGCDGELARVRFQQSALGAWLDTAVDDLLSALLPLSVGVGVRAAGGGAVAVAVGAAAAAMLVIANLIIAREMRRQRTGGDPMKVRWWFSPGGPLGDVPAAGGGAGRPRRGAGWVLFQLGRRDSAILGWLVLAALGQLWLVLATSLLIALAWFGASVVQLVARPRPAPHP